MFTYLLHTDEEDDQKKDIQTIDQLHVQAERRIKKGWDWMIKWEVLQLTNFTYVLETEEDWIG